MHLRKPRVIIVGGGPVGLTAALGLTRADIDFIVLEQRDSIVEDRGSDMTLLPMTMRVLEQLDLLEPLSKVWNPVSSIERIDHSGRGMGELSLFRYIKESTGYYPCVLSRRDLLRIFYQALPKDAQDKVLTGKKVGKIRDTQDGVVVSCTDGTVYDGVFVVGADGAFSAVREQMQDLALNAGSSDVNEAEPFVSSYQALWIRFPTASLPCCKSGIATETHGSGIAIQLFAGEETATIGVYRRLPKPTRRSLRYDGKDQAALVKEWGHLPLVKEGNFRLKDAYEARLGSGLVSLEEGVLPQWSWNGRVVLVGDAAHKFTPSTGSGLNYGIIDVVFLMNEIHELSERHNDEKQPWWHCSSLSKAFEMYQQKRLNEVTSGCQQAGGATAVATWANMGLRLLDKYLLPNPIIQWLIGTRIASKAKTTDFPAFNFEQIQFSHIPLPRAQQPEESRNKQNPPPVKCGLLRIGNLER